MRLAPLLEVVVQGIGNPVSLRFMAKIDHRRLAFLGDETGAAPYAVAHGCWPQHGGMPLPVHHVLTGNMAETDPS